MARAIGGVRKSFADLLRWNAPVNLIGRDIADDYGASSDDRAAPDPDALHDDRAMANPRVVLEDCFENLGAAAEHIRYAGQVRAMVAANDRDLRSKHYIAAQPHAGLQHAAPIDERVLAGDEISVNRAVGTHVEGWVNMSQAMPPAAPRHDPSAHKQEESATTKNASDHAGMFLIVLGEDSRRAVQALPQLRAR